MPEVTCLGCLQKLNAPDDTLGKMASCAKCGRRFVIEAAGRMSAVPPPILSRTRVSRSDSDESLDEMEEDEDEIENDLVKFDPAEGRRKWANRYLQIWKWSAVLSAIGLVLGAIGFFFAGVSYASQPSTSGYGSSLMWSAVWCLLAAAAEIVTSFGLIDIARAVLNIESMLLERDKRG